MVKHKSKIDTALDNKQVFDLCLDVQGQVFRIAFFKTMREFNGQGKRQLELLTSIEKDCSSSLNNEKFIEQFPIIFNNFLCENKIDKNYIGNIIVINEPGDHSAKRALCAFAKAYCLTLSIKLRLYHQYQSYIFYLIEEKKLKLSDNKKYAIMLDYRKSFTTLPLDMIYFCFRDDIPKVIKEKQQLLNLLDNLKNIDELFVSTRFHKEKLQSFFSEKNLKIKVSFVASKLPLEFLILPYVNNFSPNIV